MKAYIITLSLLLILFVPRAGQAQWVQLNGPYGDWVWSLTTIGTDLFAGTSNGVFRSTNNGSNWTAASAGLADTNVRAIMANGTTLFAGTSGFAQIPGSGVFRSTDSGTNWIESSAGLPTGAGVNAFAVEGTNLFAGTNGVFRSKDNGESWTQLRAGLPSDMGVDAFAVNGMNLFMGTDSGVFLSSDSGTDWTAVNKGLPTHIIIRALMVSGTNLFAGTGSGVYRSTDNGASWTAANQGLESAQVQAFAEVGPKLFAGTFGNPGGVFLSTDSGRSWASIRNDLPNTVVYTLAVIDSSLFAGAGGGQLGGLFVSNITGNHWTAVDNGLTGNIISALTSIGGTILAGTGNSVYATTDDGTHWMNANGGMPTGNVYSFATKDNNVFAANGGLVFRSSDRGSNWSSASNGLDRLDHVSCFAVIDTVLFAGTDGGVFLSTDDGNDWAATDASKVVQVAALATAGSNLYAAGTQGLAMSSNEGNSWQSLGDFFGLQSIAIVDTNIYVGGIGIFRSTSNGKYWASVFSVSPVVNLISDNSNIFAAVAPGGVYFSADGIDWSAVTSGLPYGINVSSLLVHGSFLFAGTGNGVWRRPLSEMIPTSAVSVPTIAAPQIQNYPNPFSQFTTISFSSPDGGAAEVSIVNLLGAEVARIFSGELGAGEHTFTWDARGMAPGMYECIVRMNGHQERIPMVVLR